MIPASSDSFPRCFFSVLERWPTVNGNWLFVPLITGSLFGCSAVGHAPQSLPVSTTKPVHSTASPAVLPSEPGGLNPDSLQVEKALQRLNERIARYSRDYEAALLKGLIFYETRQFDKALTELDRIVIQAPNFHLAQMIRGDILLSRVARVTGIGHNPVLHAMPDSRYVLVEDLREEAHARLQAYLAAQDNQKLPGQLLRLGESVETAVLVDKQLNRLYLYGNTGADSPPELLYDFYISTGRSPGNKMVRGDLRTPEGVYFVTRYTPGSRLPERYGVAAFPINYPNELDRYQRKTGGGIWLHGITHQFYSRPPLDSEGCVVLSNTNLEQIISLISPKSTPFIIAERLEWLDPDLWLERKREVTQALQKWQRDWESGDAERYLSNYAADFWAEGYDFNSWSQMKQRVLANNRNPQISLSNISLLAYSPGGDIEGEIVVADFQLSYYRGDSSDRWRKRLYLRKDQGRWYILHEGNVVEEGATLANAENELRLNEQL